VKTAGRSVLPFSNYSHHTHPNLILPSKIGTDQWLTTVTTDNHRKNIFHVCVEGKQDKNRENTASTTDKLKTDGKPSKSVSVATAKEESTLSGHAQICSFLIKRYPHATQLLTGKDNNGNTPLHLASKLGRKDLFEIFIQSVNVDDQSWINSKQRTPLHECAKHGHLELIEMLLNKCKPESRNKLLQMQDINLKTALHIACQEGLSIFIFQYSSFQIRKLASNQLLDFDSFINH
jgi:ankyrin repeat protein